MVVGTADGDHTPTETGSPLVLRERPRIDLIVIAGAFMAVGVFALGRDAFVGWMIIGFTALALIALAVQWLPGACVVELDADGFTLVRYWRPVRYRWSDVGPFHTWSFGITDPSLGAGPFPVPTLGSNAGVVFDIPARNGSWAMLNRTLTGGAAASLPGRFGLPSAQLAGIMNAWRDSARAEGSTSSDRCE